MRNRLHLAVIKPERRFQQAFAVAGRAGARNHRRVGHLLHQFAHRRTRRLNRAAGIARVVAVQQFTLFANQRDFRRRRTRVNAQIALAGIRCQIAALHLRLCVAAVERRIFLLIAEQRRQVLQAEGQHDAVFEAFEQAVHRHSFVLAVRKRRHRRARRRKKVRIFRHNRRFLRQVQGTDKRLPQFGQEVQRPAQERHMPANRLAARQPGNRLVHNRLKNRRRQILTRRALVNQRLNVALGKHAAARRNGVQLMIVLCQFVQAGRIGFQQRRHLVDKRPRAARAHAVHALFQSAGEIDNLRVLAAQFDGDVGLRRGLLQRFRHRDDFLYEPDAQRFRQRNCARSGHAHLHAARAEFLPRFPHHLRQRLLRMRAVAAIFAPDHFSRFVQQHQLDGGRTDVNARIIIGVCFHSSTSSVGLSAATTSESARKMIGFSFCALCRFSRSEVQSESF